MKINITAEEYAGLPEALKEHYIADGEGYKLKLEDDKGDLEGKIRNAEKLLEERKVEEERRKQLEIELNKLKDRDKEEELKRLEEQGKFQEVLERTKTEYEKRLETLETKARDEAQQRRDMMVNVAVKDAAVKIAGERATIIEPHLRMRFQVSEENGVEKVVITDATGLPNPAMNTDRLVDEFKANPLWAGIVAGTDSAGLGTGGGTGGGNGIGEWDKYFDEKSNDYNVTKQFELSKSDPTLYAQLSKKYGL